MPPTAYAEYKIFSPITKSFPPFFSILLLKTAGGLFTLLSSIPTSSCTKDYAGTGTKINQVSSTMIASVGLGFPLPPPPHPSPTFVVGSDGGG